MHLYSEAAVELSLLCLSSTLLVILNILEVELGDRKTRYTAKNNLGGGVLTLN